MDTIKTYLTHPTIKNILFWIGMFSYYTLIANMAFYSGYRHLFEVYFLIVGVQMVTAFVVIKFLIPRFLNKNKTAQFIFYLLLLLYVMFGVYIAIKVNYFDIRYLASYNDISRAYAQETFLYRVTHLSVFLSKCILFLTPTVLLLLASFYKNQKEYLQLNEQKKVAELSALKNQLNPHFLFNTLNNLYSLAIKKSDKTPTVIGKLSDILDYMLYRCDEKYVALDKEIELIQNYLTLEKVRYGKRVNVNFETDIDQNLKVAPLLFLTFIENAFKHGVREELKIATINIKLETKKDEILFHIENSIPSTTITEKIGKDKIGLKNVKKQLDLLYPKKHELQIDATNKTYKVALKINTI